MHGLHVGYLTKQARTELWTFILCGNCGEPFARMLWITEDLGMFSLLVDCAVVPNTSGVQSSYQAVYETVVSNLGALAQVIEEKYPELFDDVEDFPQADMSILKIGKDGHFFKPLKVVEKA